MTTPEARTAALREAGYRGPVDRFGFAESGDRVADMARNYWAGRDARQKEEQQMTSNHNDGPHVRDGGEISDDLIAARDAYQAGDMTWDDLEVACSSAGADPDDLFAASRPQPMPARLMDGRVVECGPYGPIATQEDREQTEAWLAEDREQAAAAAADAEREMTPAEIADLYVDAGLCSAPERDYEAGQ